MTKTILFCTLLLLAACDAVPPTPTPTRALSGPTLAPSPSVLPVMPSAEPTELRFLGQNDATAAALPSGAELPPLAAGTTVPGELRQPIQMTAGDGTLLNGDLYVASGGERAPTVLMIAPVRGTWLDLPLRLQAEGFTVLTMDLRGGGVLVPGDFAIMLASLVQLSAVDPDRIVVLGSEGGADIALYGCADSLCDALALLSPLDRAGTLSALNRYNPRPLFVAAAEDDPLYSVSVALQQAAQGTVVFASQSGTARGTSLLRDYPALGDQIIEWLRAQLDM